MNLPGFRLTVRLLRVRDELLREKDARVKAIPVRFNASRSRTSVRHARFRKRSSPITPRPHRLCVTAEGFKETIGRVCEKDDGLSEKSARVGAEKTRFKVRSALLGERTVRFNERSALLGERTAPASRSPKAMPGRLERVLPAIAQSGRTSSGRR
jgi:hypothetical protein